MRLIAILACSLVLTGCSTSTEPGTDVETDALTEQVCTLDSSVEHDYAKSIGCKADFELLSSNPMSASIPGARSAKTVIDRLDEDNFYVQNTGKYKIHWEFVHANLSGNGKPPVPPLSQFNSTEYYSPDRRFLLGALTYYEGPAKWVYQISPYDTSTAEMITTAYDIIAANTYFGAELFFHPTSAGVEKEAGNLPERVKVITTDELFDGITYQPLNLATGVGRLVFKTAEELEAEPPDFRDLIVLDAVPNDIGVVAGIVTAEFQTPLSHINVLSQNRGTPNMGLIGALENEELRALDGQWVSLTVGAFEWTVTGISKEEADTWWNTNKPQKILVPPMALDVTELTDIEDILDLKTLPLGDALAKAIPAFGGKASHYGAFPHMTDDMGASHGTACQEGNTCETGYVCKNTSDGPACHIAVPVPKAFGIPLYYYRQHMEENGLDPMVETMMAEAGFQSDPVTRKAKLEALQEAIKTAPLNETFLAAVFDKMLTDYPGVRMRFRSSTNAEDLDGFTGAGLYTSKSGDLNDASRPVADAIRTVWASIWNYKAYQEREYRSIDHNAVGMALLVHRSFQDEEANGVALTGNIFDTSGLEPGFYINVQEGEDSVVIPEGGHTTDQFIYYYYQPGQPVVFLSHSSLIQQDETVLTNKETYRVGQALDRIHQYFKDLYGSEVGKFYGMDVEFKFDVSVDGEPNLYVKQARPHPGWGL
jgi:hypothetical protein